MDDDVCSPLEEALAKWEDERLEGKETSEGFENVEALYRQMKGSLCIARGELQEGIDMLRRAQVEFRFSGNATHELIITNFLIGKL